MSLTNQGSLWPFKPSWELQKYYRVKEGKRGKEIPQSSRLEFLEKSSANNFALSDAEDNTSGLLIRGDIAALPLLKILLAIRQNCFVFLAYANLAASRALLQRSLACLNFILDWEDLSFWYKQKKWFLWTMTAAQAAENHGDEWGLTWYFLWGIYTSIPTWTHSQNSLAAVEALSLKISSHVISLNDHEDRRKQHENNHKQCNETGHPVVNMMESQWKLKQQHDQNFLLEEN